MGLSGIAQLLGLSPLTRGNRLKHKPAATDVGPIPAHAGEPKIAMSVSQRKRAYPRSRGGTEGASMDDEEIPGLSPLTRGNPHQRIGHVPVSGPIPAHAGEPTMGRQTYPVPRAYPRSRGGTEARKDADRIDWGLSPLTRGNLLHKTIECLFCGPIPAHAGEPLALLVVIAIVGAYPRSRGGTGILLPSLNSGKGLSPLTRGNPSRLSH